MPTKLDVKLNIIKTAIVYVIFAIFTDLVSLIDVQSIGPSRSAVGFATLNGKFWRFTGIHTSLFTITDFLAIIAIIVMIYFAAYAAYQLMTRKSFFSVDSQFYALGITYIIMIIVYLIFEVIIINYRPVLIDDVLEASYPSSHTMLSVTVFITGAMEYYRMFSQKKALRITFVSICIVFTLISVLGRLFAGVHWLTDIIGSLLLSTALIFTFKTFEMIFSRLFAERLNKNK